MNIANKQGRYSAYLTPLFFIIDLIIINYLAWKYLFKDNHAYNAIIIMSLGWAIISFIVKL